MDTVEAELVNTVVVVVGGTRPSVLPAQVQQFLSRFFQVGEEEAMVMCYHPVDFLIHFTSRQSANCVLHALTLEGAQS
jgi:hypothetical protein